MEEIIDRRDLPPAPTPYPWLIFFHGREMRNQSFCTMLEPRKSYSRNIPELSRTEVWGSCHGWLVLSRNRHFSLWNPVTLDSVSLPTLNHNQEVRYCTLSSPPRHPDSMVLLFSRSRPLIIFCRVGDQQWNEMEYGEEIRIIGESQDGNDVLHCPVICNGKLYALTFRRSILVAIEIVKPNILVIRSLGLSSRLPCPKVYSMRAATYLVESCGEIFANYVHYGGRGGLKEVISVEVLRFDLSLMDWIKVESLKDRAFFVGENSSVSCSVIEPGIERSCIYLIVEEDLWSFNVERKSVSFSLLSQESPTSWDSTVWLMPNLRITNIRQDSEHRIIGIEEENEDMEVEENENYVKDVKDEREERDKHLFDLPSDIITSVVKHLNVVDYLRFNAVCRKSRSLAPVIRCRTENNRMEVPSISPWLMFFEEDSVCSFFDPKHGSIYQVNLSPLLLGCIICCSKDGWLLMSRGLDGTFFCNPFTKEIIKVEYEDLDNVYGWDTTCIGFSSSPTSPDCVVVQIFGLLGVVYFRIYYVGEDEWDFDHFYNNIDFEPYDNSPVFYNGAFYFLGQNGNLGVLEFQDEISWKILPRPRRPCKSFYQNFLVECDGDLFSVFVGHLLKWVRVFRLNHSTMTWDRVLNLGNHMIFVSRSSSFSTVATTSGMENKVYFPRFCGQSIVFYSLDTRKFHSFESKDSVVDIYNTREHLDCGWIEPML